METPLKEQLSTEFEAHLGILRKRLFEIKNTGAFKDAYGLTGTWFDTLQHMIFKVSPATALPVVGGLITEIEEIIKKPGKAVNKNFEYSRNLLSEAWQFSDEEAVKKQKNTIKRELIAELKSYRGWLSVLNNSLKEQIDSEGSPATTEKLMLSWSVPMLGAFLELLRVGEVIDAETYSKRRVANIVLSSFSTRDGRGSRKTLEGAMNPKYDAWTDLSNQLSKLAKIAQSQASRELNQDY